MILSHLALSGFRGFKHPVRLEFSPTYTVIDGRNGSGKSTICDAVEYALTGTISKYLDASSDRETVADYIWWCGESTDKVERYVEVGFRNGSSVHCIRKTPYSSSDKDISTIESNLVDVEAAPPGALQQVCSATIIRDEHITRLSLDLKDTERYLLLREAIGASDAEEWNKRSSALLAMTSGRLESSTQELERARIGIKNSVSELDRVQAQLSQRPAIDKAVSALQELLNVTAPVEVIGNIGRKRLADIGSTIDVLNKAFDDWPEIERLRQELPTLQLNVDALQSALTECEAELASHVKALHGDTSSSELSRQARQIQELVILGRDVGRHEEHCPLCNSTIDSGQYERGLEIAQNLAKDLDERAAGQVVRERARNKAEGSVTKAKEELKVAVSRRDAAMARIEDYDAQLKAVGLTGSSSREISKMLRALKVEREAISSNVRILDTMSLSPLLASTQEKLKGSKLRMEEAERKQGKARLAEQQAKAIHNAVRRAAGETLRARLDRVLPLMSELYRRLSPHPVWQDIEYHIRGDLRRFLKLQVGDDINPQFVFSSGQRRATGLAFLLSVNLSIAWSRWKTLVLDDPVQHVDDFRAIHLAEVLGHFRDTGRQIVCAVEDSSLADLMCRRLGWIRD